MKSYIKRREGRIRRKKSIRKKIRGTTARPRMSVFRSSKHIYAQVIDDTQGVTLVSASSLEPELREKCASLSGKDAAKEVGLEVGKRCLAKAIDKVVFDRNGFIFHGRVKALADAARESGLDF
ncbi:MAG: 50S ribosomal protein L18 [Myxococcales bacterium]|nr:50S ribosomal protein L18 [Myxococcales bacterium]